MQTREGTLKPVAPRENITALNTVKALTVPDGARLALLKVETKAVRWSDDGTNPSGTDGTLIDVGDEFFYNGDLKAIRFIEDGATATATLRVNYYR